jgi:serine/threonine-protein kinase
MATDELESSLPGGSSPPPETLDALLREGPLPPREAAELLEKLARAVESSHWDGVAPGNLRPANVLLAEDGSLEITHRSAANDDSAAARYLAPEHDTAGAEIDPTTDVFTLGVILYEAITAAPPFCAPGEAETREQVRSHAPVPPRRLQPKTPRALQTICLKCLRKKPQRRYANPRALAEDLRRYLEGRRILARSEPPWDRAIAFVRRSPAAAGVIVAMALALVLAVAALDEYWREVAAELRETNARHEIALEAAGGISQDVIEASRRLAESDPDRARRLLDSAADLYERLLPGEAAPQALADKGRMLNDLAQAYLEMNVRDRAEQCLEEALAIHEQLVARSPRLLPYQLALARSQRIRGDVLRSRGSLAEALEAYQEAEATLRRLVELRANDPAFQHELSVTLSGIGAVYVQQEDLEQAGRAYEEAFARAARSGGEPSGPLDRRRQLALCHEQRGSVLRAYGDYKAALDQYGAAQEIYEELLNRDPSEPRLRRDLERVTVAIAETIQQDLGDAPAP